MKKEVTISGVFEYSDECFEELTDHLAQEMTFNAVRESPELLEMEVTEVED